MLPWTTRVHNPNDISIGSAVFAGLTIVTDRQTDRRTVGYYAVCNNRPHLRVRSTVVASFSLRIIIVGLPCRKYQQPAMERVQALADISRSALCCLSNETHAPMANLPNSA